MADVPPALPLWGWFLDTDTGRSVRAVHMDCDFDFLAELGVRRGRAGQWLIEEADGSQPRAWDDAAFRAVYAPLDPARPEKGQPPEPAPPFRGVRREPDTEVLE